MTSNNISAIQLNQLNIETRNHHELDADEDLGLRNDANGNSTAVPAIWGMPLKYVSLVTLAFQNSLLTIIMHWSRVSTPASERYSAATAVLMNEILKGSISLIIAFWRIEVPPPIIPPTPAVAPRAEMPFLVKLRKLRREVFSPDCWKLSIPAILYVIQNNLQFVAASNLEAATFQVTYQMKILTTAGFSVLLLRKKLLITQWASLLFLAIGVGIVQMQGITSTATSHGREDMDALKGFLAVFAACFTSGLAGVYFEMVLKNSPGDLWVRNVQLSLFSLLPAITPILFGSTGVRFGDEGWLSSLFRHFGPWAWATVAIQVLGGLVTAMVIKYSDNILKGFATSLSIVISFLASVALFDFQITFSFLLGSAIVLNATWLYNQQPKRAGLVTAMDATGLIRTLNEQLKGNGSARSLGSQEPLQRDLNTSLTSSRSSSVISLATLSNTAVTSPRLSSDDSDGPGKKHGFSW